MTLNSPYPATVPLFPLTGVLLLPGAHIPLHIFENRYRNMIEDALAEDEPYIGVIQPLVPKQDNAPDPDLPVVDDPDLYGVGCLGLVEHWERLPDGRYVTLIKGTRRFRCVRELPMHRGYRRMQVEYDEFELDETESEIQPDRLMRALRSFADSHQISLEFDRLSQLSGRTLLNSMAMALPFAPAEKQALLEATDISQRYDTLLALMDMGVDLQQEGGDAPPPMTN